MKPRRSSRQDVAATFLALMLASLSVVACTEDNPQYGGPGKEDSGLGDSGQGADGDTDTDTDTDSDTDTDTDTDTDSDSDSDVSPFDECIGHEGEEICSADGQAILKCPTDGSEPDRQPCGDGQGCVDGACAAWACTPYAVECDATDETKYRECKFDGSGWNEGLSCPPDRFFCDATAGGCVLTCRYLVMFMVDKSGSMAGTKWQQLNQAVGTIVNDPNFQDTVWFGLSVYPSSGCSVSGNPRVAVADAATSAPAIVSQLSSISPSGSTPIHDALKFVRDAALQTFKDDRFQSILIFLTDGEGNCNNDNPGDIGTITSELVSQDILTYAIGFGDSGEYDPDQLNAIAQNGGTGVTTFYPANDLDSLIQVFYEIFGNFHDC